MIFFLSPEDGKKSGCPKKRNRPKTNHGFFPLITVNKVRHFTNFFLGVFFSLRLVAVLYIFSWIFFLVAGFWRYSMNNDCKSMLYFFVVFSSAGILSLSFFLQTDTFEPGKPG